MATDQPVSDNNSNPDNPSKPEATWTFRGHQMQPDEFNTAMLNFYRGEMERANTWRSRLDVTTNWAVITTAAALFFTFSDPGYHSGLIILSTLMITLFLWVESRRYRYYELWAYRVRLMETDFFAAMLVPPFAPNPDWAESLAESLLQPDFPITMWEAFGRRFRRNYMWIFLILGLAWGLKEYLHPLPVTSWEEFILRAAFGVIPGWIMITMGLVYNGLLFLIGFATAGLRQSSGEVLPKFGDFPVISELWHRKESRTVVDDTSTKEVTRVLRRRQQVLTWIVTSKPKIIANRILKEMKRGVTGLHSEGMFTQVEGEVLMVAIAITEMARLKSLVRTEDPNAFMVVTQAQEIFGRGFKPLAI